MNRYTIGAWGSVIGAFLCCFIFVIDVRRQAIYREDQHKMAIDGHTECDCICHENHGRRPGEFRISHNPFKSENNCECRCHK